MPAQHTPRHQQDSGSQRSSPSSSTHSQFQHHVRHSDEREKEISFDHFYAVFDSEDQINNMSRILAGRPELILRTYMIHHCRATTNRLIDEIKRQKAIALKFFQQSKQQGLQDVVRPFLHGNDLENNDNRQALSLPPPVPTPRYPAIPVVPPQSPSPISIPRSSSSKTTPAHDSSQFLLTQLVLPEQGSQSSSSSSAVLHPLGTIHNPIVINDGDVDDETETEEDDSGLPSLWVPPVFQYETLCTHCEQGNHAAIDCDYFQCPTCHVYAPGHTPTNCFFCHD